MAWQSAQKSLTGICLCAWIAVTAQASGGAYVVDDATIGKAGECQVESWVSVSSNGSFIGVTQPACVVNLVAPVELTATAQAARLDAEWATLTGLQAKFVLVPMGASNLGVALVINTTQNTANGTNATFLNVPLTIKLSDSLRLNLNGGWLHDTVDDASHFTWGSGIAWDFRPQWALIAEVYGISGHLDEPRVQMGLRFSPASNLDLDLIYGHNISGENANWVTAGLTVRFP